MRIQKRLHLPSTSHSRIETAGATMLRCRECGLCPSCSQGNRRASAKLTAAGSRRRACRTEDEDRSPAPPNPFEHGEASGLESRDGEGFHGIASEPKVYHGP